jgi:small ligand-binding sensory domain FIST
MKNKAVVESYNQVSSTLAEKMRELIVMIKADFEEDADEKLKLSVLEDLSPLRMVDALACSYYNDFQNLGLQFATL